MHAARSDLMTDLARAGSMRVEASCYDGMSIPEPREHLENDPGCFKSLEASMLVWGAAMRSSRLDAFAACRWLTNLLGSHGRGAFVKLN